LIFKRGDFLEKRVLFHEELGFVFLQLEDVEVILIHELLIGFLVLGYFFAPLLDLSSLLAFVSGFKLLLLTFEGLFLLNEDFLHVSVFFIFRKDALQLQVLLFICLELVLQFLDLLLLLIILEFHRDLHRLQLLRYPPVYRRFF
jgi:hypothetical protein